MGTMHLGRGLPGEKAGGISFVMALYSVMLPAVLIFIAYATTLPTLHVGHLRSPLLQWAFATPFGAVAVTLAGMCFVGLSRLWLGDTISFRRRIAEAMDVTNLPVEEWPRSLLPRRQILSWRERWLGRSWVEKALNLTLLFAIMALVGALVPIGISWVQYGSAHSFYCRNDVCAPLYPSMFMGLAGEFAGLWAQDAIPYWRLRRAERKCGIWLRTWGFAGAYYYVRRPDMTAEAAAAAVARFAPGRVRPVARRLALGILSFVPFFLVPCAGFFLAGWLPLQWIPR